MFMSVEYLPCVGHTIKGSIYYQTLPHNTIRKKLQIPFVGEPTGSGNLGITSKGQEVAHSDSTAMKKQKILYLLYLTLSKAHVKTCSCETGEKYSYRTQHINVNFA